MILRNFLIDELTAHGNSNKPKALKISVESCRMPEILTGGNNKD